MDTKVYSVHDSVAEIYFPPFNFNSDEEAARMFADCVNTPNHKFEKNPGDYSLCLLGAWDNKTGKFTQCKNTPKTIAVGTDFARPKDVNESLPF